jgi:hypothetical protein
MDHFSPPSAWKGLSGLYPLAGTSRPGGEIWGGGSPLVLVWTGGPHVTGGRCFGGQWVFIGGPLAQGFFCVLRSALDQPGARRARAGAYVPESVVGPWDIARQPSVVGGRPTVVLPFRRGKQRYGPSFPLCGNPVTRWVVGITLVSWAGDLNLETGHNKAPFPSPPPQARAGLVKAEGLAVPPRGVWRAGSVPPDFFPGFRAPQPGFSGTMPERGNRFGMYRNCGRKRQLHATDRKKT